MAFRAGVRSSKTLPSLLWSSRFLPTPVRKRSIWRSASKSAAATPRLAWSSGRPKAAAASWKLAVALVQQQGVAQALGADDCRGQVDVELAVAVGVEGGDGRAEAGTNPADDSPVSLEILRPRPSGRRRPA